MSSDQGPPNDRMRRLADPRTMRALAHPVRIALVELLTIDGPHTATEAGDAIGESPSNCSFHLRQLAKYGFVEETGDGYGRRRPWRVVDIGTTIPDTGLDARAAVAADSLVELFQKRWLDRWQAWRANRRSYPSVWQELAGSTETVWWLTPAELEDIRSELLALAMRHRERLADPALRPPDAEPVEFVSLVFPFRPPGGK